MVNKKLYNILLSLGILSFLIILSLFVFDYYKTYYSENTNFKEESVFVYIKSGSGLKSFKNQMKRLINLSKDQEEKE